MHGVLGNFTGKVKPWYLPFDWVFCRISINYKTRVIIVKNDTAPNIYGLPVEIVNRKVVSVRMGDLPLPELPTIEQSEGPQKFILKYKNGDIFATRNFSDVNPEWRKYKRMGWALRYIK